MTTLLALTHDVLVDARAFIDTPEKWSRGAFARTAGGHAVALTSPKAACFCAIGAIDRVTGSGDFVGERRAATLALRDQLPRDIFPSVANYNDDPSTTHAHILELFDKAIASCK